MLLVGEVVGSLLVGEQHRNVVIGKARILQGIDDILGLRSPARDTNTALAITSPFLHCSAGQNVELIVRSICSGHLPGIVRHGGLFLLHPHWSA